MKMMVFYGKNRSGPDQRVPGLGYIYRNGVNFLSAIIRLEEFLSGTYKRGRVKD